MIPSLEMLLAIWLLATAAGLDLVSVLQVLLSRPLVVGTATGLLVGDPAAGLRVGCVLELFALDVVPVGSSRYPDFGAATVAAVVFAAGEPVGQVLGASVGLGLALAVVAGGTLPVTRRLNARVVRAYTDRLAAGDLVAVRSVHLTCLGHDLARSAVVALAAVSFGLLLRIADLRPDPVVGRVLNIVVLAGAAWAVAHGAMASARTGPRWRWALAGLVAGSLLVMTR